MDFSKFSHEDFDVKGWVNGALEAYKDNQSSLDAHASSLVMKLQLFIQEVNQGLEEVSRDMINNLPRVRRDLEAVEQEAMLLRQQMQVVKADIKKVEVDTALSMSSLVELDTIMSRMEESYQALQEADNWTTLAADTDTVFDSKDIHKIAEKLAGMDQSLHVLHDVSDFEERHKFLESLKDRFEAILSPHLVGSFGSSDTEQASVYVRMYVSMGRASQLRECYITYHKKEILQQWKIIHSTSDNFHSALSAFYEMMLTWTKKQLSWCSGVGVSSVLVVPPLYCQTLTSLTPSLTQCLQDAVRASETPLTYLLQLRQMCFKFLSELEKAVQLSEGACVGGEAMLELVESVHGPYCQMLVRYPSMETHMLKQQLHSVNLSVVGGLEEGVASMRGSVSWVFQYASEAVQRCFQLTRGWGCHGLVKSLQAFFSQYTSTLSSNIHQLRRGCGLSGKGESQAAKSMVPRGEEWVWLQHVFQLLEMCGDLWLQVESLDEQIKTSLSEVAMEMQTSASAHAPFNTYDYLAVYHPEERTTTMALLDSVRTAASTGASSVLPSSVWAELQALNEQVHTFAYDVIFQPLKQNLERVPLLQVWSGVMSPVESPQALSSEGLPHFSLSPLPYITEIGDYLLTLPRQLEPFTSQESAGLRQALKEGKLPFSRSGHGMVGEEEGHPSNEWLGAIASGVMETYTKQILLIPALPPPAATQLTTDIAYLSNVLTALGQLPSEQLMQLENLLKPTTKTEFEGLKGSPLHHSVSKLRTWD